MTAEYVVGATIHYKDDDDECYYTEVNRLGGDSPWTAVIEVRDYDMRISRTLAEEIAEQMNSRESRFRRKLKTGRDI